MGGLSYHYEQAHWLVTQAISQPKPAKELAWPDAQKLNEISTKR